MKNTVKKIFNSNKLIYQFSKYILASLGYYNYKNRIAYKNYLLDEHWKKRIDDVISCPDNSFIPTVADAGKVNGSYQIMHNGLKIHLGSYYWFGITEMLRKNKGVHEPQEERIFMEVLKKIPDNGIMLELGSYWAFYSMWFYKEVRNAGCYLIEPDRFGFEAGKKNFKLNKMKGNFFNAYISSKSNKTGKEVPTICIDDFVKETKIPFIHILHSDIQGHEMEMLKGTEQAISEKKIGYFFISTHSNELHNQCLDFLKRNNFIIVSSANIEQSYSVDGLIVARSSFYPGIDTINIALRGK